jgi:hypothetical protein
VRIYVATSPGQLSVAGTTIEIIPGVTCALGLADPIVQAAPTGMFVPLQVQVGIAAGPQ